VVNPEATRAQFEGAAVSAPALLESERDYRHEGAINQSTFQDIRWLELVIAYQTNVYIVG